MSARRHFFTSTVLFFVITAVSVVVLGLVVFGGYQVVRLVVESSQPTEEATNTDPQAAPDELTTDQPLAVEDDVETTEQAVTDRAVSDLIDPAWVNTVAESTGIPARALAAYAGADAHLRQTQGCSVGWNTLAGIGYVETRHGTLQGGQIDADGVARPEIYGIPLDGSTTALIYDTDGGVLDGDTEFDRAVGPMQFIPETWRRWGQDGSGDGTIDPHQIDDAALTAASYLCSSRDGLESSSSWISAIRSYNNSVQYQNDVAEAASRYAGLAAD